jgi:hypothetical protein
MLGVKTSWKGLDDEFARIERELTATARGVTVSLWKDILKRTPQWSGAMAASWTYSIGSPVTVSRDHLVDQPDDVTGEDQEDGEDTLLFGPKQKGHIEAILIANQASAGAELRFKLGDVVYFGNGVHSDLYGGEYAGPLEAGAFKLRGVNMPGRPAALAIRAMTLRYGQGIKKASAGQLKNLRIL